VFVGGLALIAAGFGGSRALKRRARIREIQRDLGR
jgi:hypothetical protein